MLVTHLLHSLILRATFHCARRLIFTSFLGVMRFAQSFGFFKIFAFRDQAFLAGFIVLYSPMFTTKILVYWFCVASINFASWAISFGDKSEWIPMPLISSKVHSTIAAIRRDFVTPVHLADILHLQRVPI
jgi:hypothetical protein